MAESKKKPDEQPEAQKAAKEAVKEVNPPSDADEFPVERLINEPGFLRKHPPHVLAGALSGITKKNVTLEEAEAAVDAWLKSPVKEA